MTYEETWRPASNGTGKRHWGAARFGGREWAEDIRGHTIWVGSRESAQRLADRKNAAMRGHINDPV